MGFAFTSSVVGKYICVILIKKYTFFSKRLRERVRKKYFRLPPENLPDGFARRDAGLIAFQKNIV
jgi:hypothetical protein